jgi:transposase-like protein
MKRPPRPKLTDEEKQLAEQLLSDGASMREVARTIGRSASVICRRFPGRGWTLEQVAERASLDRRFKGVL